MPHPHNNLEKVSTPHSVCQALGFQWGYCNEKYLRTEGWRTLPGTEQPQKGGHTPGEGRRPGHPRMAELWQEARDEEAANDQARGRGGGTIFQERALKGPLPTAPGARALGPPVRQGLP